MSYTTTYPPPFPIQATRGRGQVSAAPFDPDGLTGSQRLMICVNSLLANHVGALAQDAWIDPGADALTKEARLLRFVVEPLWAVDLDATQSLVDVWIYVVRPVVSDTWTINLQTSIDAAAAVVVTGDVATPAGGEWWLAATLAVDDTAALGGVVIGVAVFDEGVPDSRAEAVAIIPNPLASLLAGKELGQMGRTMTPLDEGFFVEEEAAFTLTLQWAATMLQKLARRGACAYASSQQHVAGLGILLDFGVMLLDDVPDDCETATFRVLVSAFSLAGTSFINVGDDNIPIAAVGIFTLVIPVTPGEETRLVIKGQNVTTEYFSLFYHEAPA